MSRAYLSRLRTIWLLALLFARPALVEPCGPWFPSSIIGTRQWLDAPEADFERELINLGLAPETVRKRESGEPYDSTVEADLVDVKTAFGEKNPELFEEYKHLRARVTELKNGPKDEAAATDVVTAIDKLHRAGLPRQFSLYLQGAARWHSADAETAQKLWSELLELPASERQHRSTWAAYMLGHAHLPEAGKAREQFQLVRRLATAGFTDATGLVNASYGWEALTEHIEGNPAKAIALYLKQAPLDLESLKIVVRTALADASEDELIALAKNAQSRGVIMAHVISRHKPAAEYTLAWLNAVEEAGVTNEQIADRLALAAYQTGEMDQARRWIALARNSITAQWLKAKLHLYDGELEAAAKILRRLATLYPTTPEAPPKRLEYALSVPHDNYELATAGPRKLQAELGAIELARDHFVESLDAFMKAEYWSDAAWVAERVLTLSELKKYIDDQTSGQPSESWTNLRALLARRLTRASRVSEARQYFTPEVVPHLDAFKEHLARGFQTGLPNETRADHLFKAAQIMRHEGRALVGTEGFPDWNINPGFDFGLTEDDRRATEHDSLPPTPEELKRLEASRPKLTQRYSFRYLAAEIGWHAAALLPNNDDHTARILCESGSWIKYLDPEKADRFYKALVRRCRKTEVGELADRMRWFPLLDENGNLRKKPEPSPLPAEPEGAQDSASSATLQLPSEERGYTGSLERRL